LKTRSLQYGKAGIILGLIFLLLIAAAVFIYLQIRTDEIGNTVKEERTIKLLLIVGGAEEGAPDTGFSEAIFFQSGTGKAAIVDVPMNTGVLLQSENRIDRIDTGFSPEDPGEYRDRVAKLLDTELPYYIYLDSAEYRKLIDIIEGVDLFIANPVETIFRGQTALLPSGSVTLDGAKAMLYGLFEDENEPEAERVGRRQKLVQATLKKISVRSDYILQPQVLSTMRDLMRTNISERALGSLAEALGRLDQDQIVFQRVLGNTREVEGEELLFPHYEGTLLRETIEQTLTSLNNAEVVSNEELNLTLEILNGTMRNGLAGRTSQVFKSFGYDVARVANAQSQDREETVIIDRIGNLTAARKVANIIQCDNVISRPQQATEEPAEAPAATRERIDVTIILGKDFDGRYCKE
jgi:anionic cell wall polymer biosynthesis LytR-Cps2A-Psr (LCP) family protein